MTHYFSLARLQARPSDSALLRTLSGQADAYRDHALVWRLFPGDGLPRDFVFRQDLDLTGTLRYHIVSRRKPDDVDGLFELRSKLYAPRLQQGAVLRFDLRANPTVSRRDPAGVSRRHDVLMDAKRLASRPADIDAAMEQAALDWLSTRSRQWGLEPVQGSVLQTGYQQHRLVPRGKRIEFSSLDYSGIARVTDPDALRGALLEGVGHARGFGCGLLLVRHAD